MIKVYHDKPFVCNGRLKQIGPSFRVRRSGNLRRTAVFQCACGNVIVAVVRDVLRNKGTKSCGCWKSGLGASRLKTHGKTKTPEYRVWKSMCNRCHNVNCDYYGDYGGRGVVVCDEWRGAGGFERFLAHIGERPSSRHEIDRINNENGYEPGNVRWTTRYENVRNTRRNRLLTIDGVTLCVSDWAELSGVHRATIRDRLEAGWTEERAVFETPRKTRTTCES